MLEVSLCRCTVSIPRSWGAVRQEPKSQGIWRYPKRSPTSAAFLESMLRVHAGLGVIRNVLFLHLKELRQNYLHLKYFG